MEIENTLTPEQINELTEKAKLAEDYKAKYEQAEKDKAGMTEELKEERRKKQEAADIAKAALEAGDPDAKIISVVEKRLEEEKSKQIEMTRAQFEEKFKSSNPEFQPSNDAGGLKFQAFKKVLSRFNLNGLTTEAEFAGVYNDAMLLLKREEKSGSQNINHNAFAPGTTSSGAIETPSGDLLPREEKLIASIGWTKEKYLKLKASQPNFVETLLMRVRD